ncbi:hypothetical protein CC78DRAFT_524503 [Lojkania enalia]|uniref:Reverse transcriptase domain-containing protein n=1 Tax=Lojkania enalia TaxID=147567 RepID=A0A9P4K3T8_9PLEO|nr:hypothetical protein CC78DRAFT_524503 [Didymosphaeria enalia]
MSTQSRFLSQTLQSITLTKTREQEKRRKTFENRKAEILQDVQDSHDEGSRIKLLINAFKNLPMSNRGVWYVDDNRESTVSNATSYLEQSQFDPSVSSAVLQGFEKKFHQILEQESQRFKFADLYHRLLIECTEANGAPIVESKLNKEELDGSFEHVQRFTLQQLREKFSNVVFTPLETDEVAIDGYLHSMFEDDHAATVLEECRTRVTKFGGEFISLTSPFTRSAVVDCIHALLTNDLLNDTAKITLNQFSTNEVVLDEIADVLNLRFSDIAQWSWEADEGMYYEPRRQTNGKYRIMMDQDILQAIFLHYIAVKWSSTLKTIFRSLVQDRKFWNEAEEMTTEQRARYAYFTGAKPFVGSSIKQYKISDFQANYFLSSMPSSLKDASDPYGGTSDSDNNPKSGRGIRQWLLRQIATDVIIHRSLYGEVAVVQSDLQWYATSLPHSTLFTVLRFWGVPESWIIFFKKFAEAPLRMNETPGQNVRIRKRGIPITDAFEKLFGECVLFAMDVAVNRLSKATLIRFHDDLWLCGGPAQCAAAWETIQGFVKVLGLDINTSKTGSVYLSNRDRDSDIVTKFPQGPICMGMLQLTEKGEWAIDQGQVSAHTQQLRKQLGQCTSVISWVQIWNACMGAFFQGVFGQPANCFGQAHVDSILETYAWMQRELFEAHDGSVTNYLREVICMRFGVENIPDSFFFLPEEFGGLGLKNPFVPFFMLKGQLCKDPLDSIAKFHKEEQKAYKDAVEAFSALSDAEKQRRYKKFFEDDNAKHISITDEPFFSFEEYTMYRESHSRLLYLTYLELTLRPKGKDILLTREKEFWFQELRASHGVGWNGLSGENKWLMNLYAGDLMGRFGSLSIVDRKLLPGGALKVMGRKKVVWQLIIWE